MIEKEVVIEQIVIDREWIVTINRKTVFREDGEIIGEAKQSFKTIYPGDAFDDEVDSIKAMVTVIHTQDVVDAYAEAKRLRSIGFDK